jgi:WD40 repeat protein
VFNSLIYSGTIVFWNIFTGIILGAEKVHSKGLSCVIMLDDFSVLTTGFDKNAKHITLDQSIRYEPKKDKIKSNFFTKLVRSTQKQSRKKNMKFIREFRGHNGDIYCMELLPCKKFTATGSTDYNIKVFLIINIGLGNIYRNLCNDINRS